MQHSADEKVEEMVNNILRKWETVKEALMKDH